MQATLFDCFERVAADAPDHVAVREATRTWTYAELLARANAIAAHLDEQGAGDRVACLLSHGGEMIAAIFGVLAGGRAYVPIDPTHPVDRSTFVIEDSGATALLHDAAQSVLAARLAGGVPHVCIDDAPPGRIPARRPTPDTLAYCLYTSGSTGRPKGVPQVHANVLHFVDAYRRCLEIEPTDVVSLLSTFAFDAAVVDVFSALLSGATLCPYDLRGAGFAGLSTMLVDRGVTIYHSTPTVFRELLQMESRLPSCIRAAVLGGEEVRATDVTQFRAAAAPKAVLVNGYGMTECSWALINVIRPDDPNDRETVPLGTPINGVRVTLMPADDEPELAAGGVGTIVIESAHVAGHYWQRPEETASAFPSPGVYVTTDYGRLIPDGRIEFAGRKASHVKLRGNRIDLREIEAVVLTHPGVREVAVVLRASARGDELVAYVAGEETPDLATLRVHLSATLPGYMIPAAVVRMSALPRGATNKLDRRALPAPEEHTRSHHIAPRTPTEHVLAAIWHDLLGVDGVGIHDDFFALGGHSLTAMRLVAAIRTQLAVELPLRALFEAPTLGAFATKLDEVRAAGHARSAPPLVAGTRAERPPLSFVQQRLWFLHQLEPESSAYHLGEARRVESLDVEALSRAFEAVSARHEILRTSFPAVDGTPYQRVHAPAAWSLVVDDARELAPEAQRDRIADRERAMDRPFDLAAAPPLRVELVRVTETAYVLLVTLHHIITDGGSRDLFEGELWTLYDAFAAGAPAPASVSAPLPIQYADFAAWQRTWLVGDELARQLSFWTSHLTGAPAQITLPRVGSRPSFEGKRVTARLPAALTEQLSALAHRRGATLFMTFAAALRAVLSRYSGQSDIVLGAPIDNRSYAELADVIGMFANTMALRGEIRADDTFASLLVREKAIALDAYEHQHTPFELVVDALHVDRTLGRAPVFQVIYQHVEASPLLRGHAVDTGRAPRAPFDLTIESWVRDKELGIDIVFDTALFDASLITRFARHVERFLAEAVTDPHRNLGDLDLLDAEDRRLLAAWGVGPSALVPDARVHELIEAQVDATPDAPAVWCDGHQITYRELDARANQLAHRLRSLGVGAEVRVGVCAERSFELVVALLGVLKAGGAYVPLDPSYPADRLAFMLEDADVKVLLTQAALLDRIPPHGAQVLVLDTEWPRIARESSTRVGRCVAANNLAYVIFTSGSTGRPKGAMNEHGAVLNRLLWMQAAYRLGASDHVLQKTPFSFDVSVWEFFWPLMTGARLVMARPDGHRDPDYLTQLIREQAITTLHFVPSMLSVFLDVEGVETCTSLRRVVTSGEALAPHQVERFFTRFDSERVGLFNLYGPTEAAVDVTHWTAHPGATRVPIGRPIANLEIYIVDGTNQLTPLGVAGELLIGGIGVGRGYLGRPELTAEKFVRNPFGPGRVYRTGDLARWLSDGTIEYLGRNDFQVKIHGFRIELGEIETALLALPAIDNVAVIAREDRLGAPRLVAYVVGHGEPVDVVSLKAHLGAALPEYMVPSAFVVLDALPTTSNGKLDRAALPAPELEEAAEYIAPRDPLEMTIAEVWREVLGVDRVGVNDDFFALGGHSLTATRVAAAVRTRLGVELPLRILFEARTLAALAARVGAIGISRTTAPTLVAGPRDQRPPLSFAQQRLWFLDQLEPGSRAYHLGESRRLEHLDTVALRRAFDALVVRHEILRTSFPAVDGVPYQRVHAPATWLLPVVDVRSLDPGAQANVVTRVQTQQRLPFDLAVGPLLRTEVVRVTDDAYLLIVTLHHIITDGWSQGVLWRELWMFYAAFAAGRDAPPLAPLPLQYADFAAWQRRWMSGIELERQLAFWTARLRGSPEETTLPLARPRPVHPTERHASMVERLDAKTSAALNSLAQREGATLFMVLLAGFRALLTRVTGQRDLVIGTPIANRNRRELEALIGFFVNTLALRGEVDPDDAFTSVLARERAGALAAYDHQDIPFELVVDALHIARRLDITPLFQVWFVHQNTGNEALPGSANADAVGVEQASKFDVALYSQERGGEIELALHYNPDVLETSTVQRLVADYVTLLATVAAHPGRRIADLLSTAVAAQSTSPRPVAQQPRPSTTGYVAPRTPIELQLADLWRDLLHVERVGVRDDFFALGGHSLLAIRLLAAVQRHLGVKVPLRELFADSTLGGLATRVGQARTSDGAVERPSLNATATRRARLPAALRGVFKLNKLMTSDLFARHVWSAWIDGPVDLPLLERAIAAMRIRHALLRTRFFEGDKCEMLEVLEPADVECFPFIERIDLSSLSEVDRARADTEFHRTASFRPLDVARGEVMGVALSQWSETRHRLSVSLHNIVSDGESVTIYVNELCALWRAFASEPDRDPVAILPPALLQYHHLADYLDRVRDSEVGRAQRAFWKSRLDGIQPLELPVDSPREEIDARREANAGVVAFRSRLLERTLSREVLATIERIAASQRATVMSTLVAAMAGYLSQRTSQRDLAFITRLSHRYMPGLERALGFLVNPIVLRISTEGAPSFSELVARTHAVVNDAFDHGECDLFELAPYSAFRLCIVYTSAAPDPEGSLRLPNGSIAIRAPSPGASAESQIGYDLVLWLKHLDDRVELYFAYNLELFRDATAAAFLEGYVRYVTAVCQEPPPPRGEASAAR